MIILTKGGIKMVGFGDRLKALRLGHHFTQAQLAARLNLTKSVISAYETDLRMPSYDVLVSIARIFKVSTDYLLGVEKNEEIEEQQSVDLSGLSDEQISSLINLVRSMKKD